MNQMEVTYYEGEPACFLTFPCQGFEPYNYNHHNIPLLKHDTEIECVMLGCLCGSEPRAGHPEMEDTAGLLHVRVIKGTNLAIRDIVRQSSDPYVTLTRQSSDPYVTLTLGNQKVKTMVMHQTCQPEWNDQLTLCASKSQLTVHMAVFDHDTFSADDEMGEAEMDIKPYLNCYNNLNTMRLNKIDEAQEDALISTVQPTKQNCLAEESSILWRKDRLVHEIRLILKNVECGEIHVQIELNSGAPLNCLS